MQFKGLFVVFTCMLTDFLWYLWIKEASFCKIKKYIYKCGITVTSHRAIWEENLMHFTSK